MERITYRITLDAHKTGIQRTLQGFETGDKMSRRIAMNLVASGDTFEIPFDHVTAMMYVTQPDAKEPSINACTIEDNTIIYDILPTDIATEGITEMQFKIIEGRPDGARKVLLSPRFALEVSASNADDESVEQTTTFTALEDAVAKAKSVYDHRLMSIEMRADYALVVTYADGTIYESDALKYAFEYGDGIIINAESMLRKTTEQANLAKSYAVGGTGTRAGEDTDNAKYYNAVAKSTCLEAQMVNEDSMEIMDEVVEKSIYTTFSVNFETGNLTYLSQNYNFTIGDKGDLIFESLGEWSISEETKKLLEVLIQTTRDDIANLDEKIASVKTSLKDYVDSTNSALESLGFSVVDGMLSTTYEA